MIHNSCVYNPKRYTVCRNDNAGKTLKTVLMSTFTIWFEFD